MAHNGAHGEDRTFYGETTSRSSFGGHWPTAERDGAPSHGAGFSRKRKEESPLTLSKDAKFDGSSTLRDAFVGNGAAERRPSFAAKSSLHTDGDAAFSGRSTMSDAFSAERAALGRVRHPKDNSRVDHVRLSDGSHKSGAAPPQSVYRASFVGITGKDVRARTPSSAARVDHVDISDGTHEAMESVAHHDFVGKSAPPRTPATNARIDHVVIADGSSAARHQASSSSSPSPA